MSFRQTSATPWMIAALVATWWSPVTSADTKLLWGDTHLHTSYSFDAFLNNNLSVDPDYAYRFAKGMPVMHPYHRAWMRLDEPLDFLVVSDHAEFMGAVRRIYLDGLPREGVGILDSIRNWYATRQIRSVIDAGEGPAFFQGVLPPGADPREVAAASGQGGGGLFPAPPPGVFREAWGEIVDAAEAHYQPGAFTSLIGWEWTSTPGGANLHRVVLTDAGGELARTFQPVSSGTSPYPDDLWAWLEETSAATGARFLSIPHNSNVSKGFMFPDITLRGAPVDADHARARMRWERIVEVTQIKGDSETHPLLSPDDEFADFETFPYHLQGGESEEYLPEAGDYARAALRRGLATEAAIGINPFQFGMIGSTDSHSGLSTAARTTSAARWRRTRSRRRRTPSSFRALEPVGPCPHRAWRRYGRRRTPGRPSSTQCTGARPTRPVGRASGCVSSGDGSFRPRISTRTSRTRATGRAWPWAVSCPGRRRTPRPVSSSSRTRIRRGRISTACRW